MRTVGEIAERWGQSYDWARTHVGEHWCIDGKRYVALCVVSDPSRDHIAKALIRQIRDELRAAS